MLRLEHNRLKQITQHATCINLPSYLYKNTIRENVIEIGGTLIKSSQTDRPQEPSVSLHSAIHNE